MSKLLDQIHEYLKTNECDENDINKFDHSPVHLAMEIALYAHRNQKREDGQNYFYHPYRCLQYYRNIIGYNIDDPYSVDIELLHDFGIPFYGVQELCYLHDVVEDSEVSFDDVKELYKENNLERHFNLYIAEPLKNITHKENESYKDFIDRCMLNPISALVKMIDMQDNSYLFSLKEFGDYEYERTNNYLLQSFRINHNFQFIENINLYKSVFKKNK